MDLRELMAAIGALPVPPPVSEESLPASLRLPLRPLFENLEAWREFALQVQTLGLEGDSGENLTERVEQLENMLRNVRGYGGVEVRTGPAGISIGMRPRDEEAQLIPEVPAYWGTIVNSPDNDYIYAVTVEALGEEPVTVTEVNHFHCIPSGTVVRVIGDYVDGKWAWHFDGNLQTWWAVIGTPVGAGAPIYNTEELVDGGERDGEATEINGNAHVASGTLARVWTQVGTDRWLFEYAAGITAIDGGPGITIDETDPLVPKVSVDLATDPGLQFDAAGDAGKLRAKVNPDKAMLRESDGLGVLAHTDKAIVVSSDGVGVIANAAKAIEVSADGVGVIANTSYGISVSAAGVKVDIAATNPGLQFTGGDLAVKPNAAKAVVVEAAGVGVLANNAEAIAVDAQGVKWTYNTDKGLDTENNLAIVKVNTAAAIDVDGDGVCLVIDADDVGLKFGGAQNGLSLEIKASQGLDVDVDGLYIALYTQGTGGPYLEFVADELAHKTIHDSDQWISVGDGAGGTITLIFDRAGHFKGTYP